MHECRGNNTMPNRNTTALEILNILASISTPGSNIEPLITYLNCCSKLNLSETELTTRDIENIAEALKLNHSLVYLNLSNNNLNFDSKELLRKAIKTNTQTPLVFFGDCLISNQLLPPHLLTQQQHTAPQKISNSLFWGYSNYLFGATLTAVGMGIYLSNHCMRPTC